MSEGQELDAALRARIRIYWYWPKLEASAPHVGYGRATSYPWLIVLGLALSVCNDLYLQLVDPAIAPRMRGLVRYGLLMIPSLALGRMNDRVKWLSGYYELDANGVPVRFLSRRFPDSIKGRFGVRCDAFIRRTQSMR